MPNLAGSFFKWFMSVQFVTVLLLTPAFAAGAIAEEKERKTLEFILATDLRNREIVLSKLASRFSNLGLLILTGLPILSITQFMGGVDPDLVLAGFAATGLTMASLTALSILQSVYAKKPRDAIILTYLATVAYLGLSSLALVLQDLKSIWGFAVNLPFAMGVFDGWESGGGVELRQHLLLLRQAVERFCQSGSDCRRLTRNPRQIRPLPWVGDGHLLGLGRFAPARRGYQADLRREAKSALEPPPGRSAPHGQPTDDLEGSFCRSGSPAQLVRPYRGHSSRYRQPRPGDMDCGLLHL
jgi:hypothetical protein